VQRQAFGGSNAWLRLAFRRACAPSASGEPPAVTLGPAAFAAPSGATLRAGLGLPPGPRRRFPPRAVRGLLAGFILVGGLAAARLRAPPSARFGSASAQLRPLARPAAGSPRSRPSACTPGLADGRRGQARLCAWPRTP